MVSSISKRLGIIWWSSHCDARLEAWNEFLSDCSARKLEFVPFPLAMSKHEIIPAQLFGIGLSMSVCKSKIEPSTRHALHQFDSGSRHFDDSIYSSEYSSTSRSIKYWDSHHGTNLTQPYLKFWSQKSPPRLDKSAHHSPVREPNSTLPSVWDSNVILKSDQKWNSAQAVKTISQSTILTGTPGRWRSCTKIVSIPFHSCNSNSCLQSWSDLDQSSHNSVYWLVQPLGKLHNLVWISGPQSAWPSAELHVRNGQSIA